MISQLTGNLTQCDLNKVVVDVQGIGFAVLVPLSTRDKLPAAGATVVLYTYLQVREDALQLYGFATEDERSLFRLLITVTGIGPRLALNILSGMSVRSFCQAITASDVKALSRIHGIGKRLAERLLVELREQVEKIYPELAFAASAAGSPANLAADAVAALEKLGFKNDAARKAIQRLQRELPSEQQTAEHFIRKALTSLKA